MAVVTLDEVKSHLNITQSTYDGELQGFLNAAVSAIGERVGPLEPTARTVRVRPAGRGLRVPGPAVSLTSITDADGTAATLADLYLDGATGLVSMNDGTALTSRYYTVVYMAGRADCPANLKLAIKELVRHFWDTQRGPTRRPGSSTSDSTSNTVPGAAFAFPFRVEQLLKPYTPILVGV